MAATFAILVPHQLYRVTMHAPAGCPTTTRVRGIEPVADVRGQRFPIALTPAGRWHWCAGRYTVTVAVVRRGDRRVNALPFGSASFTLRR